MTHKDGFRNPTTPLDVLQTLRPDPANWDSLAGEPVLLTEILLQAHPV